MKRLTSLLLALGMMSVFGLTLSTSVGAINVFEACDKSADGVSNDKTTVCKSATDPDGKDSVSTLIRNVIQALLFVIGIVSVVMIIIGGIRYTLSNGDASQIKSAKDTVLYAVIGLIVAMLAYAIVGFVVGQF